MNKMYGKYIIADACLEPPITPVQEETPWKDNENGNLRTNIGWRYTMGYKFTPLNDGEITHLGGYFNGAKNVYLWDSSQNLMASATVTSDNNWAYSPIDPVQVRSGQTYRVGVYLAGSGGSYRYRINRLPQTYGNIRIDGSCYRYGSSVAYPSYCTTYAMYGQVDIGFVVQESPVQTPCIDNDGDAYCSWEADPMPDTCPSYCIESVKDCDDFDDMVPGPEVCDGIDNDCDGEVDEGCP